METRAGPLALVGGDEFQPGNEPHDRFLADAAERLGRNRPAFIIATAAARHSPETAVRTARDWFDRLGLAVEELPVRTRSQAMDVAIAERAREGRFFYLCGGDPGIVPQVLRDSAVWAAVLETWRAGAPLAGSSAGAMALGEWTLIRARMPGDSEREPRAGLGVVPTVAVLPHYSDFGHRWVGSARQALRDRNATLLAIDAKSAAVWADGRWRSMGSGQAFVVGETDQERPAREVELDLPQATGVGPG
jgi:cyanophycinase-like exopeptidase